MSNQIVSFEGGLNTRLHPQYVQPNQSIVLHNANVFDATLASSNGHTNSGETIGPYFYKFKGKYISNDLPTSFVEYDQKLFWSNEVETKYTTDGTDRHSLGTNPPDAGEILLLSRLEWDDSVPTVVTGSLSSGQFEYRIEKDTYTYALDVNATEFDFVEVTVPVIDNVPHKLYRKIGDTFILVAESDGSSDLLDGTLVDIEVGILEDVDIFSTGQYTDYRSGGICETAENIYYSYYGYGTDKVTYYGINIVNKLTGAITRLPRTPRLFDGGYNILMYTFTPLVLDEDDGVYLISAHQAHTGTQNTNYLISIWKYSFITTTWTVESHVTRESGNGSFIRPTNIIKVDDLNYAFMTKSLVDNNNYFQDFNGAINTYRNVTGDMVQYIIGTKAYAFIGTGLYSMDFDGRNQTLIKDFGATMFGPIGSAYIQRQMTQSIPNGAVITYLLSTGKIIFYNTTTLDIQEAFFDLSQLKYNNHIGPSSYSFIDGYLYFNYPNHATNIYDASSIVFQRAKINNPVQVELGDPIGTDNLDGTYTYKYTDTDVGGVNESSPSEISEELTIEKANIVIGFANVTPTSTHYRIYRHGGTVSAYYRKVSEILIADVPYTDLLSNQDILGEAVAPPSGIIAAPEYLEFLTYHRGRLWGASTDVDIDGLKIEGSRNKLFFSDLGDPLLWSDLGYLLFPEEITAIGSTPNGLLVTSLYKSYIVLGTTLDEFAILTIDNDHGCTSHQSMRSANGVLLYASRYGLMHTNGGTVQELSRSAVADNFRDFYPKYGALADNIYMIDAGKYILVYDFRSEPKFYTLDNTHVSGISNIDGSFQLSINGSRHIGFDGQQLALDYQTGELTDEMPTNLKEYEYVWVRYIGSFTLGVYLDGAESLKVSLESEVITVKRFTFPKVSNDGYNISFSLHGIGIVYSLEFKNGLRKD